METTQKTDLEKRAIDTIRVLSADFVQHANSGHPGTAMALAPIGHLLWTKFLNYNPQNPRWPNRDRFVLSNGHACILQYNFLHLTGYDLSLDDLKKFRQINSKTAGHPEYGLAPGIEATTGPLGQGFSNAVGMAIGQKYLAAKYNKPGFDLFNYHIYVMCSDGDLMEGVTSEAASIAGHLQLGNLIYLYDDNHITIEGDTAQTFTEDVNSRFAAYGWHTQDVYDVNDLDALSQAITNARLETMRPSMIRIRSTIAYGSPNKIGSASAHGAPLGVEEVKLVKKYFDFDPEQYFVIPDEVAELYRKAGIRGQSTEFKWDELLAAYEAKYPELLKEYLNARNGGLPEKWEEEIPGFVPGKKIATRDASEKIIQNLAAFIPNFIGGSADLAPSTKTHLADWESFSFEDRGGKNLHFGIREHSMGAITNGLALTDGIRPFAATFLLFSEYMKPPLRLAAIMKINPIFIFTHDSIGLGEDGTTHQPVEQLVGLRAIPNFLTIRPADANETAHAWRVALQHRGGPVALVLTRQSLPVIDQQKYGTAENLEMGAYILTESANPAEVILIATGSEVSLILEAFEELENIGIPSRIVSMPSWELFEKQNTAYKQSVFPPQLKKRLVVETGSPMGWEKYATDEGMIIGMTDFGKSAPAEVLFEHFGFTVDHIVAAVKTLVGY